jgi:hypothetical protein
MLPPPVSRPQKTQSAHHQHFNHLLKEKVLIMFLAILNGKGGIKF